MGKFRPKIVYLKLSGIKKLAKFSLCIQYYFLKVKENNTNDTNDDDTHKVILRTNS